MITAIPSGTISDPTTGNLSSIRSNNPNVTPPWEIRPCQVFVRRSTLAPARSRPNFAPRYVSHARPEKIIRAASQNSRIAPSSSRAPATAKKNAKITTETDRIPRIMRSPAGERFSMTKPAATPVSSSSTWRRSDTTTIR